MKFKLLTVMFMAVLVIGTFGVVPTVPAKVGNTFETTNGSPLDSIPEEMIPSIEQALAEDNPYLPADYDIGAVLGDRDNDYKMFYEPWKSKAAIHAMAYDEATGFLALGGGYLYDNEVHLFRHNVETNQFDKVWDTGDSVFQSDVMSLAFGDTDLNNFLEIVAACADGHVYVFEQRHIYDPYANTENQFDFVWKSPDMDRVFSVVVDDVDRDYRPDIIAGGWDGKVHLFEYDNHSGYPFVEDHWITYDQVAVLDVGDKVYSLATGDVNANGLPDIVVGTRDGTVYVYENDGVTLWINGQPFPLIYDNHYYLNWTSQNYTWSPILSMEAGELDGDTGDEIALVSQGQGVFTLDWNQDKKTFDYNKVYKEFKPWETFGYWGLDTYVDRVTEAWNVTYFDPYNGSIVEPEPINYVWGGAYFVPNASVYPFNSGMAYIPDGNFSVFDASDPSVDNATAVVDFGLDEEGTGSANADPDVWIKFSGLFISGADISPYFNFSISQDGKDFEQVSPDRFVYSGFYLKVDVDDALGRRKWDWFRYAKISVFNGATYTINSLELQQVYNLITDALSVTIGQLKEDGDLWYDGGVEQNKIIVGTVVGEMLGIKYNSSTEVYDLFWESGDDDYYTFGAGIWDMVQVNTDSDIPAWNLWSGISFDSDVGYIPNQWSSGVIDPYTEQIFNMFLAQYPEGGGLPKIVAHDIYGAVDTLTTNNVLNPINLDFQSLAWGFERVSVEPAYIWDEYYNNPPYPNNPLPMLVVGGINEDIPIDSASILFRAQLFFYYRQFYTDSFGDYVPLWQMDVDGQLTSQINLAKTTPKVSFADYDGDGDQDFVVSNGYVYMAENLKLGDEGATGHLNFTLVPGYFDDINNLETSVVWGQPDFADLDGDGDFDLVLSYDSKNGSTVFINDGTAEDPIWVEHKKIMSNPGEFTNLKLLNITDVRIVQDWGSYYDGLYLERLMELGGFDRPDYYLYGYNTYTNYLWFAEPVWGSADSFVVASYPRVARLNLNLMAGSFGKFYNLGYHVMEDWNNDADLDGWTLSITSADTDHDGKNEIIIGDYDNNVYAFEHLVNNTYKRMFRSFDLNHSETSDVSPYAYEELEGISGDFNRRIWDHAKHLVADVDLDHDGLKEIIVAANLQIYIFEEVGLFGGDAVQFVYSFDLRDTEWSDDIQFIDYVTEITALAAGNDVDSDGRGDLVVAAGPYLFIYNVNHGSFVAMEDNDYFVTTAVMEGRYFLIGNPRIANGRYAEIHAINVGDTDKDGYREILLGGIMDNRLIRQNGFVHIYECRGGTFYWSWYAPTEVTYWNPISVIELDDQDYDSEVEIIIGHANGFDMWEHEVGADNSYVKVEYVTASPNYPNVPLQSTWVSGDAFGFANRSRKCITQIRHPSADDIQVMLFEHDEAGYSKIWRKRYNVTTELWEPMGDLTLPYPQSTTIDYETEPHASSWGNRMYITWNGRASNGSSYLFVTYYDYSIPAWGPGIAVPRDVLEFGYRHSPSVFQYNDTHIGVAYVLDWQWIGFKSWTVQIKLFDNDLTGTWKSAYTQLENVGDLIVHDAEVIRLDDGRFAMAMSATNPSLYKADHDIWVAVGTNKLNFTGIYASQATTSFYEEMYVDIDELNTTDKSLVVLYERIGAVLEDRFGMIASQDDGRTWNVEGYLNTIPTDVDRVEYPGGYVQYLRGGIPLLQPEIYSPAFFARDEGGFIYAASFVNYYMYYQTLGSLSGWFKLPSLDLVYGINPQSDWALNHLHDVVDLDVGDTDGDSRREVVVAFDHQYSVNELNSSNIGGGVMYYTEDYLSPEYEYPVTGIEVSDSNGNGWDDIALSCERGDVFFFEYIDISEGFAGFYGSKQNLTVATSGIGNWANWNTLESFDLDNDGKEEMIAAQSTKGEVIAFDENGVILWNNTDAGAGFNNMLLADITNDTIPEVILGCDDDSLWVLDIQDGSVVWKNDDATTDIFAIDVADADLDGWPEIAFGTLGDDVFLLDHNGITLHQWNPGLGDVTQMTFGNYTGSENLTLAFIAGASINVMNVMNGTVFYSSSSTATYAVKPVAHDFNDDGMDDLLFARDRFQILDVNSSVLFYNSTFIYSNTTGFKGLWNIWVEDFDDDGSYEVAGYSPFGGVFLEDVDAGAVQWYYKPHPNYWTWDVSLGYFGGSGSYDILVGYVNASTASDGVLVAIDGQSGVPLWFNRTGGFPYTVSSGDIHGTGIDSGMMWDFWSHNIMAVDSYERVIPDEMEAYPVHGVYWNNEYTNATIRGTVVSDVNSDGFDEIIAWYNKSVSLINGTNGAIIWTYEVNGTPGRVRVGDMDGTGWLDVVVSDKERDIYILRGNDGNEVGAVYNAPGFNPEDFYIGDFSGAYTADEIAVLWNDGTDVFVGWYDVNGNEHYRSNVNSSGSSFHMAIGDTTGDGRPDVLMGGSDEIIHTFRGTDGVLQSAIWTGGPSVYGLYTGNMNGDAFMDYIWLDNGYDPHIINGQTHTQFAGGYINFLAPPRGTYTADLNGDGLDELVVSSERYGIYGFNRSGGEEWRWLAPLLVGAQDSTCSFTDMDGDGTDDLIFTNYGYLDVVSIVNAELLWHYSTDHRVLKPLAGRFVGPSYPMDVVSYWEGSVYVISGSLPIPVAPPIPEVPLLAAMTFADMIVMATVTGVPIFMLLMVPIAIAWRRRRRLE